MGRQLALLVSSSNYHDPTLSQLATPQVDVDEFASILRAPHIGKFEDVIVLSNEPSYLIREKVAEFFSQKNREDLLLLYFSGHGFLDVNGRLFLATVDTKRHLLSATGIAASFLTEEMDNSSSRRQILILDCCHSGAFARGSKGGIGTTVGTATAFQGMGYGRVVLTASDATQYAWEGDQVTGEKSCSVFTKWMIEGLRTGAADLGRDGYVTVDELYDYVYGQVMQLAGDRRQTPGKWSFKQEGELVIAQNPFSQLPKSKPLPEEILAALHHPLSTVRLGIVETLAQLLKNPDQNLVRSAYSALDGLTDDDSRKVSETAQKVLLSYDEQSATSSHEKEFSQHKEDSSRIQEYSIENIEIPQTKERYNIQVLPFPIKSNEQEKSFISNNNQHDSSGKEQKFSAKLIQKETQTISSQKRNRLPVILSLSLVLILGVIFAPMLQGLIPWWNSESGSDFGTIVTPTHRLLFTPTPTVVFTPTPTIVSSTLEPQLSTTSESPRQLSSFPTRVVHVLEGSIIAVSPDGEIVASTIDKTIKIWDANNGQLIRTLKVGGSYIASLAFSPDGHILASGSYDNSNALRLWDVDSGKLLKTIEDTAIWKIAFSPNGEMLATARLGDTRVWDVNAGKLLYTFPGRNKRPTTALAYSSDGKYIATEGLDNQIRLWDMNTKKEFHLLSGHKDIIRSVVFSPDNKLLASGGDDQMIKLWDTSSGRELQTLQVNHFPLNIVFHPTKHILASAGMGEYIELWDTDTYKIIHNLSCKGQILSLMFSPNGQMLVSGQTGDVVKVWQ